MKSFIKKYLDTSNRRRAPIALLTLLTIGEIGETGCTVLYQEIRNPSDKTVVTRSAGIGANSDQRVTITEETSTGKKTTYDIKNDAKQPPAVFSPWGWGYPLGYPHSYPLPDGRFYFPPTSTSWPSWNFWGTPINGGRHFRLNDLKEELRPDTKEPEILGLEILPPEQYRIAMDLFKKHKKSLENQG